MAEVLVGADGTPNGLRDDQPPLTAVTPGEGLSPVNSVPVRIDVPTADVPARHDLPATAPAPDLLRPTADGLTDKALALVDGYVHEKNPWQVSHDVFVVWQCHILGFRKWLISTDLDDGRYYEVTYDRIRHRFYLDAYVKEANRAFDDPLPGEVG